MGLTKVKSFHLASRGTNPIFRPTRRKDREATIDKCQLKNKSSNFSFGLRTYSFFAHFDAIKTSISLDFCSKVLTPVQVASISCYSNPLSCSIPKK